MTSYVSLLIPVYNEEKNIENCFESLNSQTCKDFEAIFIDDGSSDNSWQLLQNLKGKYQHLNIQLLQQKNQGAASARLYGAKNAQSPYILYHDCDDTISPNTVESIIQKISQNNNIDAIALDVHIGYMDNDQHKFKPFKYFRENNKLTGEQCFADSLDWGMHNIICMKKQIFIKANEVYQKYNPSLNNWINNDEIIGRLCFLYCHHMDRISSIYYLSHNPNSTTKRINPNYYKIFNNEIILYKITQNQLNNRILMENILMQRLKALSKRYKSQKQYLENRIEWLKQLNEGLDFIKHQKILQKLSLKDKIRYYKLFFLIKLNLL